MTVKFAEDIDRDAILLEAMLSGGIDKVRAMAMTMPDFGGGPDTVIAYANWMCHPARRTYRERVAKRIGEKTVDRSDGST